MTAEDVLFLDGLRVGLVPLWGRSEVDVSVSFSGEGSPAPPLVSDRPHKAQLLFFELSQTPLPTDP